MEYLYAILQRVVCVCNNEKIEHSNPTWTQVQPEKTNNFKANLEVFETLQQHPNWGGFFHTFREGELEVGKRLAEGGQAEIYEAKILCRDPIWDDVEWVLKVFKKGDALQDLKRQWPEGMLKHHEERVGVQNDLIPRYNCDVQGGTLLADGRFAFLMQREESDLRTIIDQAMRTDPDSAPFPMETTRSSIHEIAEGMNWLHSRDIIHRDLKAANVLVRKIDGRYCFFVADYECSVGVMGTGFWRAPEILKVCKESRAMHRPALPIFTRAADVYAFGMTCFEILTGKNPFEDIPICNFDHVLDGNRPEVPTYVDDWACDLLRRCWEHDPSKRPSFEQILSFLSKVLARIEGDAGYERKAYWTKLITKYISKYEFEEAEESDDVDVRVERSESHWSEVSELAINDVDEEVILADNAEVFKSLQSHPVWGSFFKKFSDDELVVGEKFAEGGQAELYHVEVNWENQSHHEAVLKYLRESKIAAKVFKKGTLLRHLQSQWPKGMLQYYAEKIEQSRTETPSGTSVMHLEWEKPRYISNVLCGALLEDGRFAFLMEEEYCDLRAIIYKEMQWKIDEDCGPFSKDIAEGIMHDIALGLNVLHSHDIIHRDLLASNVLVREVKNGSYEYLVADYECSIGVVGTGFWRAPEILQAIKDRDVFRRLEVFSKAADIYSYGMTCYEILTGKLPFEGHPPNDYDIVLSGQRPKVPKYVDFWARGLLNMCWEPNPNDRPSILDILQEFKLHRGRTSS